MQIVIYKWIFVILYLQSVTAENEIDNYDETVVYDDNDINNETRNNGSAVNETEENCSKCGIDIYTIKAKGRIIGGSPVVPVYKYPWIVSSHVIEEGKMRLCGGALISANFVLTAAHCLFRIQLKDHPLCFASRVHRSCFHNPEDIHLVLVGSEPEKPLKARKIIGHPKFSYRWVINDIALIQLSQPVVCSKKIMPICLPTKNLEKLDQELIIAGSGANNPDGVVSQPILREGLAKVVDPRLCSEPYQPKDFHCTIICTDAVNPGQIPCHGDSGSAIFGHFEKRFYALGITSKATSSQCDPPDTFAKIYFFMDWIKVYVGDLPSA